VEAATGPLPEVAARLLERSCALKLAALQFCGPAHFNMGYWEGFEALALSFVVLLWLCRSFVGLPAEEAAERAVRIVDHNFGYSPHLGRRLQRVSLGILARRGELEKLVAWYSR